MTDVGSSLASETLWAHPKVWHVVLLSIGCILTAVSVIVVGLQLRAVRKKGRIRIEGPNISATTLPIALRMHQMILLLCPILCTTGFMTMLAPELRDLGKFVGRVYKSIAIRAFFAMIVDTFGGELTACRSDSSGTLQQHEDRKIWAVFPCCCFWLPCLCCMTSRKFATGDLEWARFFVMQFMYLAPFIGGVQLVCFYEGVHRQARDKLGAILQVVIFASQFLGLYGNKVLVSVADQCPSLVGQAREHHDARWKVGKLAEGPELKNDWGAKMKWFLLIQGLPSLIDIMLGLFIKDPIILGNGKLEAGDRRTFFGSFVAILFNFFGAMWAWRVFPPQGYDFVRDMLAREQLQAEVIPTRELEALQKEYASIIQSRRGQDVVIIGGVLDSEDSEELTSDSETGSLV